jgi:hypothetical protein
MDRTAGFFSQFFFIINQYIYCKKRQLNFTLDTSEWTFSYKNGWTDYFNSFDLVFEDGEREQGRYGHAKVLEEIPYSAYGEVLREVYQYNDFIQSKINEKMDELGLIPGTYDSIFIRRGDKLLCEFQFIETEPYIKTLLEKNPNCNTIFLQTDDYNSFLDIQTYIRERSLDIRLITLCKENLFGFTMSGIEFHNNPSDFKENQPYINQIHDMNVQNKIIFDLNKEEMLEHMTTFLVGVDIVLQSNICITDWSSNVARFIKLWKGETVINSIGKPFDLNKMCCPSY